MTEEEYQKYEAGVLEMIAMEKAAMSIPNSKGRLPTSISEVRVITIPNRFVYGITFEHLTTEKSHFLPSEFVQEVMKLGKKYNLQMVSITEDSNV